MTKPMELGRSLPEGCLSDRMLDLRLARESGERDVIDADAHLASCQTCSARYRTLQAARAAFSLEAPSFERLAPALRRRRWWWGLAPLLAVATMIVLIARPRDSDRAKGGDALGFFVLHAGSVREGSAGEVVHPGDRLQLFTTTATARFVTVLERDPDGRTSVFFPREVRAVRHEAGQRVELPYSIQLDTTLGVGTLVGVFCDAPVAVESLRTSVEQQGPRAAWPSGCHAHSLKYETKSP
jgi:hypothetical protein